jgi:hypothetical protein
MKEKVKLDRDVVQTALKQRNEENFRSLGLLDPYFAVKLAYKPAGKNEMLVSMFISELERKDGMYMELIDFDNHPIHDKPVLYKYRHNPYYKSEYVYDPPREKKNFETYLVPVSELEIIAGKLPMDISETSQPKVETKTKISIPLEMKEPVTESIYAEKEDAHYSELTVRDIAAMLMRIPVSNKKWLNQLIVQSK